MTRTVKVGGRVWRAVASDAFVSRRLEVWYRSWSEPSCWRWVRYAKAKNGRMYWAADGEAATRRAAMLAAIASSRRKG